jgi:SAM-dependent methyltransferase
VSREESLRRIRDAAGAGVLRVVRPLVRPGDRVLEAGSGSGRFVNHLALEAGVHAVGLDYNLEANYLSHTTADALALASGFACGQLGQMPFSDETFDLVFSDSVIEHLEDPAAAVRDMARVTRPGGWVVVTTPNRLRPDGWDLYKLRYRPPYRQRSFYPWQLASLYRAAGVEAVRYFGDTLMIPRNFRLRQPGKHDERGGVMRALSARRPRGIYFKLERTAAHVLPATLWVNIGVVGRKPREMA